MSSMPTREQVLAAHTRIAGHVLHTPVEYSHSLSALVGTDVHLKLECLQVTGSFKPRISLNRLLVDALPAGADVVASSAGGHGLGLAYAARVLGLRATIFLPEHVSEFKIARIRAEGAQVVFAPSVQQARLAARAHATRIGARFVSAYNDPEVVSGGGTVGVEVLADLPRTELVVVGVGGGGLASGIGLALEERDGAV